jgi:hypothetical protein
MPLRGMSSGAFLLRPPEEGYSRDRRHSIRDLSKAYYPCNGKKKSGLRNEVDHLSVFNSAGRESFMQGFSPAFVGIALGSYDGRSIYRSLS